MSEIHLPLQTGQIIPAFTLLGSDGMPHSPWTYKQREHLVLLFTQSTTKQETIGMLRSFARHYADFREEICAILAITPDTVITNLHTQEDLHLPFPLLADPGRGVISSYTPLKDPDRSFNTCIVLADRYNAVYQQWIGENDADLPSIEELLASLRYLNKLCTP